MNYDVFKNKNVLITGSSSGIGNVIGKKFLENKSNVIFTGRGKLKDNFIQNKNKYKYFKGDLTIEKTIDELYKFVLKNFTSNLDILICNLGGGKIENKTNNEIKASILKRAAILSKEAEKAKSKKDD